MRIVVAMSGGVDSSTAAALLCEAGHEVIGLAMKTHAVAAGNGRSCCTPEDMRDARRVADHLGIPFYVLSYEDLFREEVLLPFVRAYESGRTPNPCVACNDRVKFRTLLQRAQLLGADRLATGHYARIADAGGAPALHRGVDRKKDQSYFLYRLGAEQLARVVFPVGELSKAEVRAHAQRLGLPVADKHESQEICFVSAGGYAATVEAVTGSRRPRAGPIINRAGEVLGQHEGIHHFTIGQRRGLRVAAPEPLFVTDIDAARAEVTVGARVDLETLAIDIEETVWAGDAPLADLEVEVQQRYREAPRPARIEILDAGRARVHFLAPAPRGAPGQAAVVYRGDRVLGGGTIAAPVRPGGGGPEARS